MWDGEYCGDPLVIAFRLEQSVVSGLVVLHNHVDKAGECPRDLRSNMDLPTASQIILQRTNSGRWVSVQSALGSFWGSF